MTSALAICLARDLRQYSFGRRPDGVQTVAASALAGEWESGTADGTDYILATKAAVAGDSIFIHENGVAPNKELLRVVRDVKNQSGANGDFYRAMANTVEIDDSNSANFSFRAQASGNGVNFGGSGSINDIRGVEGVARNTGNGSVSIARAIRGEVQSADGSTGNIVNGRAGEFVVYTPSTGTGTFTNATGVSISHNVPDGSITHAKGLNIGPITDGSSTNYSIYTRAGDIQRPPNTETIANTDQLVVADSDGVLKAVAHLASVASGKMMVWVVYVRCRRMLWAHP